MQLGEIGCPLKLPLCDTTGMVRPDTKKARWSYQRSSVEKKVRAEVEDPARRNIKET